MQRAEKKKKPRNRIIVRTWLPNPTPAPSKILPAINMGRLMAKVLRMAPATNKIEAIWMVSLRPNLLVKKVEAKEATMAAR